MRLGRDYYVRVAGNDYSVAPTMIGRIVAVSCDLDRVQARCAGQLVADHERSWARAQTITDPAHLDTARDLREQVRVRVRATGAPARQRPGEVVARRALTDYDRLFGLTPTPPAADNPPGNRPLQLVRP